ncbi:MAG TPA: hypothetical protein VL860_04365 [Planctomycetota bacterium]|nr:hypothetical protein [Planctomycetota bacterium]
MPSVPLVHHVYSSVGGYKTLYETQDPAAARVQKALVAVANTAYKGGMGATFRGYLRFTLPVPANAAPPRTQFGPWQLPPTTALGAGRWYIKSFPMGTDHVGRPRACVHSIVMLPERTNPPAWWQPNPLSQFENALFSTYDFPADQIFLTGRDSLQGLRERTRDQIPWQTPDLLHRPAGLEWLTGGNLPPALVGSMLKLLLFPGSRLFLLASEEHALFLARQLECILPGSYRRSGGLLLGPHYRYIVPPLGPPNLIQIARPNEYPQGECLVDLQSNPPRWIGPEPPTSPLAGMILDFLNRQDLAGLLKFIEMWDIFDEQMPTPARQIGGLSVMTSLKLIGPQASLDPWPDWTRDAAACASALPFFVQAGWLSAHDTAWHQVKIALNRIGAEHLTGEVKAWEHYIDQVKIDPTQPAPAPPMIKGIVSELAGPSHSNILRAVDETMPDKEWEIKGSGHAIPALKPDEDVDAEFDIPSDHLDTGTGANAPGKDHTDSEVLLLPSRGMDSDTGAEPASDTFDVDAEFALPALPGQSDGGNRGASDEPETQQEDWAADAQKAVPPKAPAAPGLPAHGIDAGKSRTSGAVPATPPRISSALEAEPRHEHGPGQGHRSSAARPTTSGSRKAPAGGLSGHAGPAIKPPAQPGASGVRPAGSAAKIPAAPPAASGARTKAPTPSPAPPPLKTTQSGTLIAALESDDDPTTGSSSVLISASEDAPEQNTEKKDRPAKPGESNTATLLVADSGTVMLGPGAAAPAAGKSPAQRGSGQAPATPPKSSEGAAQKSSGQGQAKPHAAPSGPGSSSGARRVAQLLEPHDEEEDGSELIELSPDEDTGATDATKAPAPGKKPPPPPPPPNPPQLPRKPPQ